MAKYLPYQFPSDGSLSLKDFSTAKPSDAPDTEKLKMAVEKGIKKMRKLQNKLYADNRHSVLIIFQAMDAAGKDGTIKHVISGINPQGTRVVSFKAPTANELEYDFLWRCYKEKPRRGNIVIFNRSYYEEVLIVKVHPSYLGAQHLPGISGESDPGQEFWELRYREINDMERFLTENGTLVLKFFLHVSKDEQKKRFLDRIDNPDKNWKFNMADLKERKLWDDYMDAYDQMLQHTSTDIAPWFVIPADDKPYMRKVVSQLIDNRLSKLDIDYPVLSPEELAGLSEARRILENED